LKIIAVPAFVSSQRTMIERPKMNYLFYNQIGNSHKYRRAIFERQLRKTTTTTRELAEQSQCFGMYMQREKRFGIRRRRFQLANYQRFNLSYYNLHTADAHIDLFELYKILEEEWKEEEKKQNVKLSFKVRALKL